MLERGRLDRECAKLDPKFEQQLAEQALVEDLERHGISWQSAGPKGFAQRGSDRGRGPFRGFRRQAGSGPVENLDLLRHPPIDPLADRDCEG